MRNLFGLMCVCALGVVPLVGCGDQNITIIIGADGTGGSSGSGGDIGAVFPCTEQGIRNAIAAGGGPYTFDCGGPTTVVTEAEIIIDTDVILEGEGNLTVDGNQAHRVFSVAEGVTAELRGFTVSGGQCMGEPFDCIGSAIKNSGTLTLKRSQS